MFIKFVDIDWLLSCVIFTLVCSLRACHMWLTWLITCLFVKFGVNLPRSFYEILKSSSFHSKFQIVNSVNLSQISFLNVWLLVQTFSKNFEKWVWMNLFLEPATLLKGTFS